MERNPIVECGIIVGLPDEKNIYEWSSTLLGAKDSYYAGGLFNLKILFPNEYPMRGPEICFLTPIYHLNVNPFFDKGQNLGHVSACYLNCWTPNSTINEALLNYLLFVMEIILFRLKFTKEGMNLNIIVIYLKGK